MRKGELRELLYQFLRRHPLSEDVKHDGPYRKFCPSDYRRTSAVRFDTGYIRMLGFDFLRCQHVLITSLSWNGLPSAIEYISSAGSFNKRLAHSYCSFNENHTSQVIHHHFDKFFLNNSSASRAPYSDSATNFALLFRLLIYPFSCSRWSPSGGPAMARDFDNDIPLSRPARRRETVAGFIVSQSKPFPTPHPCPLPAVERETAQASFHPLCLCCRPCGLTSGCYFHIAFTIKISIQSP